MGVAPSSSATFPGPSRQPQRVQILSGLEPDELTRVSARARSLRKGRGEFIYLPGDRADHVYIVRREE